MQGLAKSLFLKKELRTPWKEAFRSPDTSWEVLQKMLALKCLAFVDYALAEQLLKPYPQVEQEVALFICFLAASSRAGHLCIEVLDDEIKPSLKQIWDENAELGFNLEVMIRQGAKQLPAHLLTFVNPDQLIDPLTPICRLENYFYLQRNWIYESLFIHHWKRIEQASPALILKKEKIEQQVSLLVEQKSLLNEQAEAILKASQGCLTVITGGPGTGKTYTAGQLIKIFFEAMSPEQQKSCEFAFAAPTGKAAANLQSSLNRALGSLNHQEIEVKTLHSLLGIRTTTSKFAENSPQMLSADLILVDECSMIDVRMMAQLFAAIKPGARLILLGDRYQLPPVEAGGLFYDLVTYKKLNRQVGELKTCLRAELHEIIDFAQAINKGNADEALHILSSNLQSGVRRLHFSDLQENIKATQRMLLHHAESLFPQNLDLINDSKMLLDAFNQFRILSPLRQGPFGVDELNQLFLMNALKKNQGSWKMMPIMIVRNDYHLGLLNGEVGVLVCRGHSHEILEGYFQKGDYAVFPGKSISKDQSESGVCRFSALTLPKFEYAYCLSVHKSQGSEFEHVLLANPKGSECFGREVLYTGATRARKQLEVWGSDEVLRETISRHSQRLSGVSYRLLKKEKEKKR